MKICAFKSALIADRYQDAGDRSAFLIRESMLNLVCMFYLIDLEI